MRCIYCCDERITPSAPTIFILHSFIIFHAVTLLMSKRRQLAPEKGKSRKRSRRGDEEERATHTATHDPTPPLATGPHVELLQEVSEASYNEHLEKAMAKIREAKANRANELWVSIADCYGSMMMNGDECMMMCGCVEHHGMMMALREACDWPHCSFSSPFTLPPTQSHLYTDKGY